MRLSGLYEELDRLGIAWLAVDYPGYGRSGGSPSEAALIEAAAGGFDELGRRFPGRPRVVCGWSLGAAVAVQLAADRAARRRRSDAAQSLDRSAEPGGRALPGLDGLAAAARALRLAWASGRAALAHPGDPRRQATRSSRSTTAGGWPRRCQRRATWRSPAPATTTCWPAPRSGRRWRRISARSDREPRADELVGVTASDPQNDIAAVAMRVGLVRDRPCDRISIQEKTHPSRSGWGLRRVST